MRGEQSYRFVIRGPRVDRLADRVEPTEIRTNGDLTDLTARIIDQAHLRGILDGIADLGLRLVTLERLGPARPPSANLADDP